MLKKILSISGRPGLYQLVSYGKNMLVVDTIPAGHRFPVHSRERVMALGDISIFTVSHQHPNTNQKHKNPTKKQHQTPQPTHKHNPQNKHIHSNGKQSNTYTHTCMPGVKSELKARSNRQMRGLWYLWVGTN